MTVQVEQLAYEVVASTLPDARVEQLAYEVVASTTPAARVEQLAYEVVIAPEQIILQPPGDRSAPRRYRMQLFRRWW